MYALESVAVVTDAGEYIIRYRDQETIAGYCRECCNYGRVWTCPPYPYDPLEKLKEYGNILIIGTKACLDETTRHLPTDQESQKQISYDIMGKVRSRLDEEILELEKDFPGSLAFFAGSCYFCPNGSCARRSDLPCANPALARPSLEAYGFDMVRTASELLGIEMKWSENLVLPEYFTYVSGLFTCHDIKPQDYGKKKSGI